MLLTIAVLNYKRPKDLAEILPLLVAQAASVASSELSVEVLLVDNDPEAGAKAQWEAFALSRPDNTVGLRYEHEAIPGISAARNRALSASELSDRLVFIDDDERPSENWLRLMTDAMMLFNADAVVGPVISNFEFEPDPWIQAGEFFKRRRLATGTVLDVAATNNLLLDLSKVRAAGIIFDAEFGITGGDDTMFTREFIRSGAHMIWCDEAIVFDVVPAKRLTRKWVVQRAFSSGNTWSLVDLKLEENRLRRERRRAALAARSAVRLLGGTGRATLGLLTSNPVHQAKGSRTAARGAGMLSGALGYRFEEYRRK